MSGGTLYTYANNFRAYKAQIAAQYSGLALRLGDFSFGQTNKSPEFLAKFPAGKVPAFESDEGLLLTESNAIAYYLADDLLRGGKCVAMQAQVQQWMSWADSELFPSACAWVYPVLGIKKVDKAAEEQGKNDVLRYMAMLNQHFIKKTFLVGERVSLADVVVFCTFLQVFRYALDEATAKKYPCLKRWFVTLMNQPEFVAVIGQVKLFDSKDSKPAQQQQQQKSAKKDAKPEKQEESKEEDDEAPASTEKFVMDDFKKVYSNESETVSIPYFFEKFDPENYSIWFAEYKYNEELTKVFMSCNLISGMYQRLDKMRKIAFASCCLFGTDNNSSISGVWAWKGQDLAFLQSPDWQIDYESYSWRKLDYNSQECKDLVNQYFAWVGKDKQGRSFNQGKIFK